MGIEERKERQRGELRQAVLEATRELARTEGWSKVSIRKLASKVEYSTIIIYELFGNKESLLLALKDEGYRLLLEQYKEDEQGETPAERVKAVSLSSWRFAARYPELYQIMFGLSGTGPVEGPLTHAMPASDYIRGCLAPFAEEGQERSLFFHWWALIQGFISLRFTKHGMAEAELYNYFEEAIERFVREDVA